MVSKNAFYPANPARMALVEMELTAGTITKLELETHDAAVLRKRLELSGVNALLATWAPYAQREVDSGDKWGDASNTVRRLKARQRSIKTQLLYMGAE